MRKRILGLAAIVAVGLVALACTEKTTTVLPGNEEQPGISVSGSGSAFGQPDVAVLSLGVDAEADSVAEARAEAAEAMDAMLAALKEGGVADEDVQTTRFNVEPRYDYRDDQRRLIGFAVTNLVTAKIREIDEVGDLIDTTLAAGGDLARIEYLSFTIDDPSALEDEARREAMEDARSRAETLAEAAGVELGAPHSISEGGGPVPIAFGAADAMRLAEEDVETPIELGELEVQVSVQVVYRLEE